MVVPHADSEIAAAAASEPAGMRRDRELITEAQVRRQALRRAEVLRELSGAVFVSEVRFHDRSDALQVAVQLCGVVMLIDG